ncbi:MAG: DUF433 domain-containing protein [Myxococcota bacterium]
MGKPAANGHLIEPRYGFSEVSRILRTPRPTLRTWCLGWKEARGRKAQPAVVVPDGDLTEPACLSFFNLVEARFLAAYRGVGVPMQRVRPALEFVKERMGVPRPLLTQRFETDGRNLFIQWISERHEAKGLLDVSAGGQYAWPEVVASHFREIEFRGERPVRLWLNPAHTIAVDPTIGFGLPTIATKGVRTEILFERFETGETVDQIVEDFGLERADVEEAIRWEASPIRIAA